MSRPVLYALFLRQIPPHKIHLQKRVLSTTQDANGVVIGTADNMKHYGYILVGAISAYSSVRAAEHLNMYKQLKDNLAKSDAGELPFLFVCLVGQTEVIDSKEREELDKAEYCCQCVISDKRQYAASLKFDLVNTLQKVSNHCIPFDQ